MAVVFDGQVYESADLIPQMGSLECIGINGQQRSYFGLVADKPLLPTYDNLASGSDATLVDPAGGPTIVCMYHAGSKTWYQL